MLDSPPSLSCRVEFGTGYLAPETDVMAKPTSMRHLYEIHSAPQPPLVNAVLPEELIVELARLREFL
jgi:hypothetical protein